jgi:hypothetical protein
MVTVVARHVGLVAVEIIEMLGYTFASECATEPGLELDHFSLMLFVMLLRDYRKRIKLGLQYHSDCISPLLV